jgi:hypothetical protein
MVHAKVQFLKDYYIMTACTVFDMHANFVNVFVLMHHFDVPKKENVLWNNTTSFQLLNLIKSHIRDSFNSVILDNCAETVHYMLQCLALLSQS